MNHFLWSIRLSYMSKKSVHFLNKIVDVWICCIRSLLLTHMQSSVHKIISLFNLTEFSFDLNGVLEKKTFYSKWRKTNITDA
jgi:hypothetical protein